MKATTHISIAILFAFVGFGPVPAEAATPLTPGQIYKTSGKGVVLVFATNGSAQGSAGTGSIISEDGQVITNAHVVAKNGRPLKKLFVYLKPDKMTGSMQKDLKHRYSATLLDMNADLDLALLQIKNPPSDLTKINFVDPDEIEIGEPVVAIGHPETGGLWTLTTGSISSIIADFQGIKGKDVFQTEASVNRGNSGGPLLNAYGHMVGINTSISRKAADGLAITDINFSLKSSVAVKWLEKRRLANLAYVKPNYQPQWVVAALGLSSGTAGVVAVADPPKSPPATNPAKPVAEEKTPLAVNTKTDDDGRETYSVDGGDGKTLVVVVEPEQNEDVADDPEFAASVQNTEVVSRKLRTARTARARRKAMAQAKKRDKVKPKHLTKARPYKIDDLVDWQIREMRSLENMMDDMSRSIDKKRRRGRKNKVRNKADGMGLW